LSALTGTQRDNIAATTGGKNPAAWSSNQRIGEHCFQFSHSFVEDPNRIFQFQKSPDALKV
jgi:hypothetical protein